MNAWIEELGRRIATDQPAVLVTVAATRGSAPRAPGTHMVVGTTDSVGSIGGGQLELRAIEHARRLLAAAATPPTLLRVALGASVGQCCGGAVELVFEPMDRHAQAWVDAARAHEHARQPWGRFVALGANLAPGFGADLKHAPTAHPPPRCAHLPTWVFDQALLHAAQWPASHRVALSTGTLAARAANLLAGPADGAALARTGPDAGTLWLLDVSLPPVLEVVLFGAGHVGRAVATVLARLPMRLTWVDTRDDAFPPQPPPGVELRCTDTPLAEVSAAAPGAIFLVLTHSHALDLELVRAILARDDFRYCGMIGSHAKRASFARRLHARGHDTAAIARLHCPIGMADVVGKEPEVIAIAVAAELLQLRTHPSTHPQCPPVRMRQAP